MKNQIELSLLPGRRRAAPRILLVDDHVVVRRGLRQILTDAFGAARFGEAGDADEAQRQLQGQPWDLMLLDLNLPGRDGFELMRQALEWRPGLRVLVLSMHAEDAFALRALQGGAAGYLTKESAPQQLVGAVERVLAGGRYVSPRIAEYLATQASGLAMRSPVSRLSPRELAVLRDLAGGVLAKDIAARLKLSVKTVSTYRQRLLRKLAARTNADLVHYALAHDLSGPAAGVGRAPTRKSD